MSRIVDLSIRLDGETPVYPGDAPLRLEWLTRIPRTLYNLSTLQAGPHTGTHVDSPLHFQEDGKPVGLLSPSLFIGDAVCLDCPKPGGEDIEPSDLDGADIRSGDIVLFRTGWEEKAGTPGFFTGYPGFRPEVIEELARRGVKALGFDSPSADGQKALGAGAAAHKTAAGLSMPVYESLVNLREVAGRRFFFSGLPLLLMEAEASPVRAVAILD